MSDKFQAKRPGNGSYVKNMEAVGFSDLNGVNAFRTALYKTCDKCYMYRGSFKVNGVNILDVADPANPVVVNCVDASGPDIYFAQSAPYEKPVGKFMPAGKGE